MISWAGSPGSRAGLSKTIDVAPFGIADPVGDLGHEHPVVDLQRGPHRARGDDERLDQPGLDDEGGQDGQADGHDPFDQRPLAGLGPALLATASHRAAGPALGPVADSSLVDAVAARFVGPGAGWVAVNRLVSWLVGRALRPAPDERHRHPRRLPPMGPDPPAA